MTQTLTLAFSQGSETLARNVIQTPQGGQPLDIPVPASTSNLHVLLALTIAQVSLVYIVSDQTVTIKTNSSGSPDETVTITADCPYIWYTNCGWVNKFSHDITTIYVTNGGPTDANLSLRFGYDATP